MKKIGTLTFHWATNYGAILQAYALQKFLCKRGYTTEIINYRPKWIIFLQKINMLRKGKFSFYLKEHRLQIFRKKEMKISSSIYCNQKELIKAFERYQTIIVGSDQIWNTSFTLTAERKITLSYFLKGATEHCKRIAYAVSFGTEKVTPEYEEAIRDEILKFHSISVRENSGVEILKSCGIDAKVVCDPTLLLEKEDYEFLTAGYNFEVQKVFSYILHENQDAINIAKIVNKLYGIERDSYSFNKGMYEWLYQIQFSEIIVTNSFHGIMMSLIFNTPFIAILLRGSGMNDRLITILKYLDLEDRIVEEIDEIQIKKLCKAKIDWEKVNQLMNNFRKQSSEYILNQIED